MGLLSDAKALIVAVGVALFMGSGWYSCAKISEQRLSDAKAELAKTAAHAEALQSAITDRDHAIEQLRRIGEECNAEVDRLEHEGVQLEEDLRETERRLAEERKRWEEATLPAINAPLPQSCEDKVRETVRRVQAALRSLDYEH